MAFVLIAIILAIAVYLIMNPHKCRCRPGMWMHDPDCPRHNRK